MADIDIVKKKGSPLWPWALLGTLVLIALVWFAVGGDPEERGTTLSEDPAAIAPAPGTADGDAERTAAESVPAAVTAFAAFAAAPAAAPAAAGPAHEWVSEGIVRLTAALDAIAATDANNDRLSAHLATFKDKAGQLQVDPSSMKHATLVREVFTSAVDIMESASRAQTASDLKGQLHAVRQSAESIDAQRPLLDQKEQVEVCFNRAADVLQSLARAPRA